MRSPFVMFLMPFLFVFLRNAVLWLMAYKNNIYFSAFLKRSQFLNTKHSLNHGINKKKDHKYRVKFIFFLNQRNYSPVCYSFATYQMLNVARSTIIRHFVPDHTKNFSQLYFRKPSLQYYYLYSKGAPRTFCRIIRNF